MEQGHGLGILEVNIAKEGWHYSDDFGLRSPAVPKIFEPRSASIVYTPIAARVYGER